MQEIVRLKSGLTLYYHVTGTSFPHCDRVLHRDGGPAVVGVDHERWYQFGKIHREDGPASTNSTGAIKWYLNNTPYSFEEWCSKVQLSKEKLLELVLKYG